MQFSTSIFVRSLLSKDAHLRFSKRSKLHNLVMCRPSSFNVVTCTHTKSYKKWYRNHHSHFFCFHFWLEIQTCSLSSYTYPAFRQLNLILIFTFNSFNFSMPNWIILYQTLKKNWSFKISLLYFSFCHNWLCYNQYKLAKLYKQTFFKPFFVD